MESIIVACITGVVTLIEVILSTRRAGPSWSRWTPLTGRRSRSTTSSSSGHTAWKRGFRSWNDIENLQGKVG